MCHTFFFRAFETKLSRTVGTLRSNLSMDYPLLTEPSSARVQCLDQSIVSDVPCWSIKAHLKHLGLILKEMNVYKRVTDTTNDHWLSIVESLLGVISQKLKKINKCNSFEQVR